MKRISILVIALSLFTAGVVNGHHHYTPPRYQVHYSPYAFSYNNSGLVGGGITYSPHAFSYNSSGLVSEDMTYTPYALSYGNSGLIYNPSGYFYPGCFIYSMPIPIFVLHNENINNCLPRLRLRGTDEKPTKLQNYNEAARREIERQLQECRKVRQELRKQDGSEIIRTYLLDRNIHDFQTDHLLNISNRTISADFIIRQKNLIIKYWNTEAIQSLENEPEYKKRYYENYKKDWEDTWAKYLQAGTKVYQISASDREGIIKLLDGELGTQL